MDGERRPTRRERCQRHTRLQGRFAGPDSGLPGKVLVADVRGVADHRGIAGLGGDQEKVVDGDVRRPAELGDAPAGKYRAVLVDLHPVDLRCGDAVLAQ